MSVLEDVIGQAGQLGGRVGELVGPAKVLLARADALSAELDGLRSAGERGFAAAVRAVAEGRMALSDVPGKLADAALWASESPASHLAGHASAAARSLAAAAARDAARDVFGELRNVCDDCVVESVNLAGRLPAGVRSELDAFKAGGDVFDLWRRLGVMAARFDAAHELHWLMVKAGWLGEPPADAKLAGQVRPWTRYLDPAQPWRFDGVVPPELRLSAAHGAGAQPGLYPWDDAVRRFWAHERHMGRAVWHEDERQTAIGANGNVLSSEKKVSTMAVPPNAAKIPLPGAM